jgi:hypothetical protein
MAVGPVASFPVPAGWPWTWSFAVSSSLSFPSCIPKRFFTPPSSLHVLPPNPGRLISWCTAVLLALWTLPLLQPEGSFQNPRLPPAQNLLWLPSTLRRMPQSCAQRQAY